MALGLGIWLIVIVFLGLGLFTRPMAIANWLFVVLIPAGFESFHYHIDYVATAVGFLFIFLPISRGFSLDRLRIKLKAAGEGRTVEPQADTSELVYYALIFMGLGFVYFDSVFHKFASPMWVDGLGVWQPASLPMASWLDFSFLLNQSWMMYAAGYTTLVFETVFIFLVWFKWARWPLIVVGLGLHLGIVIVFPIPGFGMICLIVYILLVPAAFYASVGRRLRAKGSTLTVFFDDGCGICHRTRAVLDHFSLRKSVEFVGVTGADSYPQLAELPPERLLEDMHAVDQSGRIYSGVDAYVQIFSANRALLAGVAPPEDPANPLGR